MKFKVNKTISYDKKRQLGIHVEAELYEKMKGIAKKSGISFSNLVRQLLRYGINNMHEEMDT